MQKPPVNAQKDKGCRLMNRQTDQPTYGYCVARTQLKRTEMQRKQKKEGVVITRRTEAIFLPSSVNSTETTIPLSNKQHNKSRARFFSLICFLVHPPLFSLLFSFSFFFYFLFLSFFFFFIFFSFLFLVPLFLFSCCCHFPFLSFYDPRLLNSLLWTQMHRSTLS